MKKLMLSFALLLLPFGLAFATTGTGNLAVSGKLLIEDSLPLIQEDGKTWHLPPGLFSRFALEHSIRAGDNLKIEGLAQENCSPTRFGNRSDSVSILIPQKIWVNGREIDVSAFSQKNMKGGLGQAVVPSGRAGRGRFSDNMGPGNKSGSRNKSGSGNKRESGRGRRR